jgi:hypothetical protein
MRVWHVTSPQWDANGDMLAALPSGSSSVYVWAAATRELQKLDTEFRVGGHDTVMIGPECLGTYIAAYKCSGSLRAGAGKSAQTAALPLALSRSLALTLSCALALLRSCGVALAVSHTHTYTETRTRTRTSTCTRTRACADMHTHTPGPRNICNRVGPRLANAGRGDGQGQPPALLAARAPADAGGGEAHQARAVRRVGGRGGAGDWGCGQNGGRKQGGADQCFYPAVWETLPGVAADMRGHFCLL